MSIWTGQFWKATTERAISTAAQSALAVLGADELLNVLEVGWTEVGAVAAGGAVLAVLKAVVANSAGKHGPGVGGVETLTIPPGPGKRRKVD